MSEMVKTAISLIFGVIMCESLENLTNSNFK